MKSSAFLFNHSWQALIKHLTSDQTWATCHGEREEEVTNEGSSGLSKWCMKLRTRRQCLELPFTSEMCLFTHPWASQHKENHMCYRANTLGRGCIWAQSLALLEKRWLVLGWNLKNYTNLHNKHTHTHVYTYTHLHIHTLFSLLFLSHA